MTDDARPPSDWRPLADGEVIQKGDVVGGPQCRWLQARNNIGWKVGRPGANFSPYYRPVRMESVGYRWLDAGERLGDNRQAHHGTKTWGMAWNNPDFIVEGDEDYRALWPIDPFGEALTIAFAAAVADRNEPL